MNVLVTFYSETGNTQKVAEAIFASIQHTRKKLLAIDQVEDIENHDLIFCGFPVINHGLPVKITHFLQKIPLGKKLVFFATHGSLRGGEKAISAFYAALSLAHGQTILGTFGCRGQVKFQLLDALMEQPQNRTWAREAQSANDHPDSSDLEDARSFAELMLHSAENIHHDQGKF
jgi:flavodoxin